MRVYNDTMANNQNLKSWKPGQSGNLMGKPKGTKHISSWIRELLNDEDFKGTIYSKGAIIEYHGAPIRAIVQAQIQLAMDGNQKAFELLAKYGFSMNLEINNNDTFNKHIQRHRLEYDL